MTAAVQVGAGTQVRDTPARSLLFEGLAIWVALSVVNLLLLVRVQNESDDSLWYLWFIRRGHATELFSPYHLVASWIGWAAYNGVRLLGYDGGPLIPMQVLNALFGAAGIAILWLLIRFATNARVPAIAAAGALSVSYGYWAYSLGPDIYPFATASLIAALAAAYYATMNPRGIHYALFGLLGGVSVLGHNSNALFVLTVGGGSLVLVLRQAGLRRAIELGLCYSAGVLLAIVPLYGAALATVKASTPSEAYDWLTAYAQSGEWGYIRASNLPKAIVGAGRAFIGGHFLFSLDPVRDWAEDASGGKSLREEVYLARDFPRWLAYLLAVPIIAIGGALLVLAFNWLSRWRLLERGPRTLATLCLAWLLPVVLFAFWWEPVNLEFWMAAWVPLIILLALPLAAASGERSRRIDAVVVGVLLVSLFTVNFFGSIVPQLTEDNDYWRQRIAWYEQNATEDDLILANNHSETFYLRYFTPATVIEIDVPWLDNGKDSDRAFVVVNDEVADWDGRVLISDEVFDPASDEYSSCVEGQRPCIDFVAKLREEYQPGSTVIAEDDLEKVWELNR
jgi:hypothetical protein